MKDEELRQKLVAHLTSLGVDAPVCPVCKTQEWGVESVSLSPLYEPASYGGMVPLGRSIPLIPCICVKCGFVYYFSYHMVVAERTPGNGGTD